VSRVVSDVTDSFTPTFFCWSREKRICEVSVCRKKAVCDMCHMRNYIIISDASLCCISVVKQSIIF
jgi:hypothetical protein